MLVSTSPRCSGVRLWLLCLACCALASVARSEEPVHLQKRLPRPSTRVEAPGRIVAIGDLHGDLAVAQLSLELAGAIDSSGKWIGGDLVVVQLGDQIDRGDDDRAIIDLFERLTIEAHVAGGAVYPLVGNHEAMNVDLDFRSVTRKSVEAFTEFEQDFQLSEGSRLVRPEARGRAAAFSPSGRYAEILSRRNVVMVIGDTVFVHGGITPSYARYGLERINREASEWMAGTGDRPKWVSDSRAGPLWSRRYSSRVRKRDCRTLGGVLRALGVKRMVVGHTQQFDGINARCGERVWRVDVGLSSHYGGPVEIMELVGDTVRVIRAE